MQLQCNADEMEGKSTKAIAELAFQRVSIAEESVVDQCANKKSTSWTCLTYELSLHRVGEVQPQIILDYRLVHFRQSY